MPLLIRKTPTPAPFFQPSSQVPFIFSATADEAWAVQPVPASWILEIEGDIFTGSVVLDGVTFVVENTADFTPTTFKCVDGEPLTTLTNLTKAMGCRPKFLEKWQYYLTTTTLGASLTLTAKSASYISGEFSTDIVGTTPTETFTPNVQGTLKPNFKFVYQMSVKENFSPYVEYPCHPLQYVEAKVTQITNLDDLYINLSEVAKAFLKTELIRKRCDEGLWNYSAGKVFTIRYGVSSTLFDGTENVYLFSAGEYFIINSAIDTIAGVEPYVRRNPSDSLYKGRALNQFFDAPMHLGTKSIAWAYIYYNAIDYIQDPKPVEVKLIVEAIQYKGLNTYGTLERRELVVEDLNSTNLGVAALPIGMGNLGLVYDPNATNVLLTFKVEAFMPDTSTQTITLFSHNYPICTCCDNGLEIYFLSRTGAYETIIFDDYKHITTSEVTQNELSSERYARNFSPSDSSLINDYLKRGEVGGKTQFNGTATKDIKLTYTARPSKELSKFLESLLLSESRFIRDKYDTARGWLYATPFTIKHSSSEIDRATGLLKFEVVISIDTTELQEW